MIYRTQTNHDLKLSSQLLVASMNRYQISPKRENANFTVPPCTSMHRVVFKIDPLLSFLQTPLLQSSRLIPYYLFSKHLYSDIKIQHKLLYLNIPPYLDLENWKFELVFQTFQKTESFSCTAIHAIDLSVPINGY